MIIRNGSARATALGVLMLVAALLPAAALAAPPAQGAPIDPVVIAAIQAAAVHVAQAVGGGTGAPLLGETEPGLPITTTVASTATAPLTPTVVVIPGADDFDEYTNQGVSILAPRQWNVDTTGTDDLFAMQDEAAGLAVRITGFGTGFPGLIAFPIFEGNAELLAQSFAEDAALTSVTRSTLEQNVPTLRIAFTATQDGKPKGGVLYVYATGSSALALMAGADLAHWPELEPVIDQIATSLLFDDDVIDLQVAGADGLVYSDDDIASFTLPADWYMATLDDSEMRLVIADPALKAVGALLLEVDIAKDDAQLKALTEALAGALSGDDAQAFAEDFVQMLDLGSDSFAIDAAQTKVIPTDGDSLGVIRIGGEMPIEDGPMLPTTLYTAIYTDKVLALVFFGAPADVQAAEESILQILDSTTFK